MSETTLENQRPVDRLLNEYAESHQNGLNKAIHWVAVPVIAWTVLALIWSIPFPQNQLGFSYLNWCTIGLVITLCYYLYLSIPLAIGMVAFSVSSVALIIGYEGVAPIPLWQFAIALFVVAWIAQFYGHKVEGKKPSFFKDVQFLLIGPAWLMHFLFNRWGIKY